MFVMKPDSLTRVKVVVVDREGAEHELLWEPDQSLMEVIRDNDLPVLASCGGNCACATCHVYAEPETFARLKVRSDDELDMLCETGVFRPDASRLACQILFSEDLDGLKVKLAPYDSEAPG